MVHVAGLYDLYTKYYSVGTSSSNNFFHNQTRAMAFGIFTYDYVYIYIYIYLNLVVF